jgi:hypothetical protein
MGVRLKEIYDLFNARQSPSQDVIERLSLSERLGAVFRSLLSPSPDENLKENLHELDIEEYDEVWESAAVNLAFGRDAIDEKTAQNVLSADSDYKKTYLDILRESSDYAEERLTFANRLIARAGGKSAGGAPASFFDRAANVCAGTVSNLKKFLETPDFSAFVPAARFETLAAFAAGDASKQFVAEGALPNGSGYKVTYQPFETTLEIEAFRAYPPRVLYFRTNNDQSAFERYSNSWTVAKPDKWIMKLSPDYPAIVALPEWNFVILAQSYKSLTREREDDAE